MTERFELEELTDISNVCEGQVFETDSRVGCLPVGSRVTIKRDATGLYFECPAGNHSITHNVVALAFNTQTGRYCTHVHGLRMVKN